MTSPDDARTTFLGTLQRPGFPIPATLTWRQVSLEYQPGIALTCATPHPGIPDMGIDHDTEGIYDCCPPLFIEVESEELAAYLVAVLNSQGESRVECQCCDFGNHTMPCTCPSAACCHPNRHPATTSGDPR